MTKNRYVYSTFLICASLWWGWTFLVDMFVIRTVFATVSNFFEAGDLGIAVFSKLNNLEIIVSSFLVGLLSFQMMKNRKALPLMVMSIFCWIISMAYFVFLTPKLMTLTDLWKKADSAGTTAIAGISDIQQAHQFYHNLYIGLDSVKLLLLTVMIIYGMVKEEKWT